MRRVVLIAACLAAASCLSACQEQRTVILEQTQSGSVAANGVQAYPQPRPAQPHYAGAPQCAPPRGTGPFTHLDNPANSAHLRPPPGALADHVSGCGGVRFRIGSDGVPQDLQVLADYPAGYGFGDAVKELIEGSRWSPRDDLSWHYLNATVHVPHA